MQQRGTLLSRHRILDPYYQIHHNPGILEDAVDFSLADWTEEPRRIGRWLSRLLKISKRTSIRMISRLVYRLFTLIWFSAYFFVNQVARLLR